MGESPDDGEPPVLKAPMGIQGEFFERPVESPALPDDISTPVAPRESKRGMKDLSIPKLYYSISEVSRLTGLEQYVLRYWETVFDELRPQKNRAGNRIYSNQDIKFILKIKELLRERRYTIEGAKHLLKEERQSERDRTSPEVESAPDPDQIKLSTEAPQGSSSAVTSPALNPLVTLSLAEIRAMKDALLSLKSLFVRPNQD